MNRAYSVLTVKSVEDERRIISGVATSPTPDRMGDIVEPLGVTFKNPLPLLHQHKSDQPVGNVRFNRPTKNGITFEARLPKIEADGALKQRVDTAWEEVKAGLVRGVSIGFRDLESSRLEGGGIRFLKAEVLELSLVTIPANQEATITAIKSFDAKARAASGRSAQPASSNSANGVSPGVSGSTTNPRNGVGKMQTFEQRISALEDARSEKSARMEELFSDGQFADDDEKAEYRTIAKELEALDEELSDLRSYQKALGTAERVTPDTVKAKGEQRQRLRPSAVPAAAIDKDAAPGIRFARLAKVKALAYLEQITVSEAAERAYGPHKGEMVLTDIKADVSAGSTSQPGWATELVGTESTAFADFAEFLRPMTIVGKFGANGIPSLRRVPFRTRLISQGTGGAAYWVAEGAAKPLTKFTFESRTLEPTKVATIAAVTEELIRDSSPSADAIVRDQLAQALAAELDSVFIGSAAASGAKPAGILESISAITSEGPDVDDVRVDVRRIVEGFTDADNPPTTAVWIMRPSTALALSLMVNTLGVTPEGFSGITMNGGTFFGLPVITSNHVGAGVVALINTGDVYFADEGGTRVDFSREASLLMTNDASGNMASTDGGSPDDATMANVVSMWQTNSVAFRAERTVNWMRRRDTGVFRLGTVNWGKVGSPLS